jgi:mono/diheme cytochrome c family protein
MNVHLQTPIVSTLHILALFAVLSVAAHAQDVPSAIDPAWIAPATAAARQNPLRDRPTAMPGGRKIFQHTCVTCHGDEMHERTNHAPDLASNDVQQEPDGALFWRISHGNARHKMPSFSNLPEAERWQLVLYIRSLAPPKSAVK